MYESVGVESKQVMGYDFILIYSQLNQFNLTICNTYNKCSTKEQSQSCLQEAPRVFSSLGGLQGVFEGPTIPLVEGRQGPQVWRYSITS